MLDNVHMADAVLGATREHEDEAPTITGVAAELIADPLEGPPHCVDRNPAPDSDRDVDDRLRGEPGNGGGADVLNRDRLRT